MKELNLPENVVLQDIKNDPITEKQLEQIKSLTTSYEALFSKRARLYKEMNLKEKNLSENDYKSYILKHYTFLKRPVLIYNDSLFIGNSKKVVESAKIALNA